jgi:hypothetical protein
MAKSDHKGSKPLPLDHKSVYDNLLICKIQIWRKIVKAAVTIALITSVLISGACMAIVGGAGMMSLTAAILHMAVGG